MLSTSSEYPFEGDGDDLIDMDHFGDSCSFQTSKKAKRTPVFGGDGLRRVETPERIDSSFSAENLMKINSLMSANLTKSPIPALAAFEDEFMSSFKMVRDDLTFFKIIII